MKWPWLPAAVLILGTSAPATAETWGADTSYGSIQLAVLDFDAGPEAQETANPRSIITSVGHRLTDAFGIEGRLGVRAGNDEVRGELPEQDPGEVTVRMDRLVGLYGVAHLPLGGRFDGYAMAGYTDARGSIADRDTAVARSEGGPSIGVGIDYAVGADYRLSLEYMRYVDRGDFELSALGIGLSIRL